MAVSSSQRGSPMRRSVASDLFPDAVVRERRYVAIRDGNTGRAVNSASLPARDRYPTGSGSLSTVAGGDVVPDGEGRPLTSRGVAWTPDAPWSLTQPAELLDLDAVSEARLILTCGLPGSGKTILARQLALDRRALRLTQDEWLWALGSSPWDAATRKKVDLQLWYLAQDVLRLGLSVVLDFGLWARVERDEMRAAARDLGVGVELHFLDVPLDELWRRIEARNSEPPWDSEPIRRPHLDEWAAVFQAPDAAELALFDSPPGSD